MISAIRKGLALLLATAIIFSLAACGTKTTQKTEAQPNSNTQKTEVQPEAKKAIEPVVIKYPTFQVGVNSSAPILKKNVEEFNKKFKD